MASGEAGTFFPLNGKRVYWSLLANPHRDLLGDLPIGEEAQGQNKPPVGHGGFSRSALSWREFRAQVRPRGRPRRGPSSEKRGGNRSRAWAATRDVASGEEQVRLFLTEFTCTS